MNHVQVLLLAFLIGAVAGLRSLTAPAVVAWGANGHSLNLQGTPVSFMGSTIVLVIFLLAAAAELVADKLPSTPNRKAPLGLAGRGVFGALSGASIAVAGGQPIALGAVLGAVGGIAGAFAGYAARTRLVRALNVRDWVVAILEDVVAIGGGLLIVSRL